MPSTVRLRVCDTDVQEKMRRLIIEVDYMLFQLSVRRTKVTTAALSTQMHAAQSAMTRQQ